MSDGKTTVKDLASMLGANAKDILRVLRDLNIAARSTSSTISDDDLPRVKARLNMEQAEQEGRREVHPGVIVRRRRAVEEPVAAETPAPEAVKAAPVQDAPQAGDIAAAKPVVQTVAAEQPAVAPQAAAPATEATSKPKKTSRAPVEAPAARVIKRPSAPQPEAPAVAPVAAVAAAPAAAAAKVVPAVQAPEAEHTAPADDAHAKAARRVQPAASAMPEGSSAPSLLPPVSEGRAFGDGDSEGVDADGNFRKKRPDQNAQPQVRIISRPAPDRQPRPAAPQPAAQPGGYRGNNQGGAPGGYRGNNQGAAQPGGYAPAGARPAMPAQALPDSNREGQSKKKRNKNQNRRGGDAEFVAQGVMHRDDDENMTRLRGRRRPKQRQQPQATQPQKAIRRKIRVDEVIRVADLAHQMGLKSSEIIKILFNLGIMATINKALDLETASVIASEFGYEVERAGFAEEDYLTPAIADNADDLKLRPPVVTIMGHVDHGKTSLLDAIRKTNVSSGEAGGITQHIGAYHVTTKRGEIVFLDTPGHEAFTAMRARGAQVTDIVVLVVAADDGVMEQTREAISHAKAAKVPIMVAVNKIDKPDANLDRVLRELAELGLQAESWGGDTVTANVSAKTREGIDELLELIALQAEIMELKANPDKPARGHIVEAKLDKGRGPVATVLIQEGTLNQGDAFVCGVFSGRVRAMFNDQGRKVKEAGPSMPVEVQGFDGVPEAGEEFICLTDEKMARRIADTRSVKQRERELAKESRVTLETFLSRKQDDQEAQVLNLVLKADVQGSLEAITEAVKKLSTEKVRINVIHGGAGAITESDILLATASEAIVIGFNVRPTAKVKDVAEQEHVDIRFYDIIYKLVDEIKAAMTGLLAPVQREVYLGQAEVREVFTVPKVGAVAGSHVSDGKMLRNAGVRLLRDGVVVYTGKIGSLRRFKDDVREVLKGYECGIGLENFNDIKVGDVFEAYEMVQEAGTL